MADDASKGACGGKPSDEDTSRGRGKVRMELRDSLPGGRAVIAVEHEGEFIWVASKTHVSEQARDEFVDQLQRIVSGGWWVQSWPGPTR